jgi:hypothetical protein
MHSPSEEQAVLLLVAVAVSLVLALGCGEPARRIGQPDMRLNTLGTSAQR